MRENDWAHLLAGEQAGARHVVEHHQHESPHIHLLDGLVGVDASGNIVEDDLADGFQALHELRRRTHNAGRSKLKSGRNERGQCADLSARQTRCMRMACCAVKGGGKVWCAVKGAVARCGTPPIEESRPSRAGTSDWPAAAEPWGASPNNTEALGAHPRHGRTGEGFMFNRNRVYAWGWGVVLVGLGGGMLGVRWAGGRVQGAGCRGRVEGSVTPDSGSS